MFRLDALVGVALQKKKNHDSVTKLGIQVGETCMNTTKAIKGLKTAAKKIVPKKTVKNGPKP